MFPRGPVDDADAAGKASELCSCATTACLCVCDRPFYSPHVVWACLAGVPGPTFGEAMV